MRKRTESEFLADCGQQIVQLQLKGVAPSMIGSIRLLESITRTAGSEDTSMRVTLWVDYIFQWAVESIERDKYSYRRMLMCRHRWISADDRKQIEKDVPRTKSWLSKSAGAPTLSEDEEKARLEQVRNVLQAHATRASMMASPPVDGMDDYDKPFDEEEDGVAAYLQGMNGIAYAMLAATDGNEEMTYDMLVAITDKLLPGMFSNDDELGEDSLQRTGKFFEDLVQTLNPEVSEAVRARMMPIQIFAYKWLLTLFTDVQMSEDDSSLPFDTLLTCWEICFLLGMEGVMLVALALMEAALPAVLELSEGIDLGAMSAEGGGFGQMDPGMMAAMSAMERLIPTMNEVWSKLRPEGTPFLSRLAFPLKLPPPPLPPPSPLSLPHLFSPLFPLSPPFLPPLLFLAELTDCVCNMLMAIDEADADEASDKQAWVSCKERLLRLRRQQQRRLQIRQKQLARKKQHQAAQQTGVVTGVGANVVTGVGANVSAGVSAGASGSRGRAKERSTLWRPMLRSTSIALQAGARREAAPSHRAAAEPPSPPRTPTASAAAAASAARKAGKTRGKAKGANGAGGSASSKAHSAAMALGISLEPSTVVSSRSRKSKHLAITIPADEHHEQRLSTPTLSAAGAAGAAGGAGGAGGAPSLVQCASPGPSTVRLREGVESGRQSSSSNKSLASRGSRDSVNRWSKIRKAMKIGKLSNSEQGGLRGRLDENAHGRLGSSEGGQRLSRHALSSSADQAGLAGSSSSSGGGGSSGRDQERIKSSGRDQERSKSPSPQIRWGHLRDAVRTGAFVKSGERHGEDWRDSTKAFLNSTANWRPQQHGQHGWQGQQTASWDGTHAADHLTVTDVAMFGTTPRNAAAAALDRGTDSRHQRPQSTKNMRECASMASASSVSTSFDARGSSKGGGSKGSNFASSSLDARGVSKLQRASRTRLSGGGIPAARPSPRPPLHSSRNNSPFNSFNQSIEGNLTGKPAGKSASKHHPHSARASTGDVPHTFCSGDLPLKGTSSSLESTGQLPFQSPFSSGEYLSAHSQSDNLSVDMVSVEMSTSTLIDDTPQVGSTARCVVAASGDAGAGAVRWRKIRNIVKEGAAQGLAQGNTRQKGGAGIAKGATKEGGVRTGGVQRTNAGVLRRSMDAMDALRVGLESGPPSSSRQAAPAAVPAGAPVAVPVPARGTVFSFDDADQVARSSSVGGNRLVTPKRALMTPTMAAMSSSSKKHTPTRNASSSLSAPVAHATASASAAADGGADGGADGERKVSLSERLKRAREKAKNDRFEIAYSPDPASALGTSSRGLDLESPPPRSDMYAGGLDLGGEEYGVDLGDSTPHFRGWQEELGAHQKRKQPSPPTMVSGDGRFIVHM
jgi:hypothetical protein